MINEIEDDWNEIKGQREDDKSLSENGNEWRESQIRAMNIA